MLLDFSGQSNTQKAKGFMAMQEDGKLYTPAFWAYSLPLTDEDKKIITGWSVGTPFVRPCPTRARHGFVDSRAVNSLAELEQVERETLAEDPNGELIVMQQIGCAASMIITPHNVAIGPGHDGATQGNDSMLLPLAYVSLGEQGLEVSGKNPAPLLANAGINETAYFEVLRDYATLSGNPQFVQLRNGPKPPPPFEGNWIPEDTVVTGFISDAMSELDFEREIKTVKKGTVVLHQGGTAISHYFAHANTHRVPVIFEGEVAVGDTLKKNVVELPVRTDRFAMGLEQGATLPMNSKERYSALGRFALTMIHNATVLKSDYHGAHLLGCAISIMMRLAFTAILGEYRHVRKEQRERHHVYAETLASFDSYWNCRAEVTRAERSFLTSRRWRPGFGGKKWGACSTSAKALERSIVKFIRSRTADDMNRVVLAGHSTLNQAHNNGPFLSKFISPKIFDQAAHGELSLTAQSAFTAHWLTQIPHTPVYGSILSKWKQARVTGNTVMLDTVTQKPSTPRPDMTLQFHWRDDQPHFQFGKMGEYVSTTLPVGFGLTETLDFLHEFSDNNLADSTSFAGSEKQYWILCTNTGLGFKCQHLSASHWQIPDTPWGVNPEVGLPPSLVEVLTKNGINVSEILYKITVMEATNV